MFDWSREVKIAEERYKDERRAVEYYRLVDEAERGWPHQPGLLARLLAVLASLLARLGELLMKWGCQLETRYTQMKQQTVVPVIEGLRARVSAPMRRSCRA